MKMIASRELAAAPGRTWKLLETEGTLVITKDGKPRGILLPTSDSTLFEDLQNQNRIRAQRATSAMRRRAAELGLDSMTMEEIDAEIAAVRKEAKEHRHTKVKASR